jgi:hypothetical protein
LSEQGETRVNEANPGEAYGDGKLPSAFPMFWIFFFDLGIRGLGGVGVKRVEETIIYVRN